MTCSSKTGSRSSAAWLQGPGHKAALLLGAPSQGQREVELPGSLPTLKAQRWLCQGISAFQPDSSQVLSADAFWMIPAITNFKYRRSTEPGPVLELHRLIHPTAGTRIPYGCRFLSCSTSHPCLRPGKAAKGGPSP